MGPREERTMGEQELRNFMRSQVSEIELTNAMLDPANREIIRSILILQRKAVEHIGESQGVELLVRCLNSRKEQPNALMMIKLETIVKIEDPLKPGVFP